MTDEPEPTTPPIRPPGSSMDEERTPPYPQPQPEHLPPREARRIEHVLGRKPDAVHVTLAERYRVEGADPLIVMAQIAIDVHDLKKPVSIATRIAYWGAGGIVGAIIFVALLVSNRSERDTAVEYRLRALEELRQRIEILIERLERSRPDYPVASGPPTSKGPVP